MNHPGLGTLRKSEDEDWVTEFAYENRTIEVTITPDGMVGREVLDLAAEVVRFVDDLDAKSKKVAARDLCVTYNSAWNEYDEVQEDGTTKPVSNPELTQAEFAQKLTLESVSVSGRLITFFYDDQGMFWGHFVLVNFTDGVQFLNAQGEFFG